MYFKWILKEIRNIYNVNREKKNVLQMKKFEKKNVKEMLNDIVKECMEGVRSFRWPTANSETVSFRGKLRKWSKCYSSSCENLFTLK